jgi:hypothetical protein
MIARILLVWYSAPPLQDGGGGFETTHMLGVAIAVLLSLNIVVGLSRNGGGGGRKGRPRSSIPPPSLP